MASCQKQGEQKDTIFWEALDQIYKPYIENPVRITGYPIAKVKEKF